METKKDNFLEDYWIMLILPIIFIIIALILRSPVELIQDLKDIALERDVLLIDYIALVGLAGAILNVAIVGLMSIFLLYISKRKIDGIAIASIYTVMGFAFIGKNIINIIPIYLGGLVYCKHRDVDLKEIVVTLIFVTTLAPLVSELMFHLGLKPTYGIIAGGLVGILIGYIVSPLASHMVNFHKGYSIYNIGFVGGIMGTVAIALLRSFGIEIERQLLVTGDYHSPILYFTLAFSLFLIGMAFFRTENPKGKYGELAGEKGKLSGDFMEKYGEGAILINMGIVGLIGLAYVLVSRGNLDGITASGILTMMGFAANVKHARNILPVMLGVFLAGHITGADTASSALIIAGLYGTTLAPIVSDFGNLAGVVAGFLHLALGANVIGLHSGVHLYNNGFAGGFVAASMLPLLVMMRKSS